MTSQGHAYTRLRRVLETRSSAVMIRAAAAELPSVPLEDALDICLALLELKPNSYPRIATRWGSRLAIERKLDLVDAQLASPHSPRSQTLAPAPAPRRSSRSPPATSSEALKSSSSRGSIAEASAGDPALRRSASVRLTIACCHHRPQRRRPGYRRSPLRPARSGRGRPGWWLLRRSSGASLFVARHVPRADPRPQGARQGATIGRGRPDARVSCSRVGSASRSSRIHSADGYRPGSASE